MTSVISRCVSVAGCVCGLRLGGGRVAAESVRLKNSSLPHIWRPAAALAAAALAAVVLATVVLATVVLAAVVLAAVALAAAAVAAALDPGDHLVLWRRNDHLQSVLKHLFFKITVLILSLLWMEIIFSAFLNDNKNVNMVYKSYPITSLLYTLI